MKIGAVFRFLIQEVTTITPGRGKLLYCYYHLYELPEATRAMLLPRINSGEALSSQKTCDSLDTKSVPESSELGDDSQASREDSNGEGSASNASLPSFNRAPSSSSAPSPSLRPMVWSESPNLRSQVGLSPSIRPMVGLYGDKKMVQVLPPASMPSLDLPRRGLQDASLQDASVRAEKLHNDVDVRVLLLDNATSRSQMNWASFSRTHYPRQFFDFINNHSSEDSAWAVAVPTHPSFNRAPSGSSEPSPSLRPMVWSESPNLRSQVGLSPSIRPMVGLYGDKKMVQVLPSMPSMERRPSMLSMDPPSMDRPCVRQVKSVALHDSRQSVFRSTALSPSSEDSAWARHAAAEVDARKRAKKAMISGVAKMFNL